MKFAVGFVLHSQRAKLVLKMSEKFRQRTLNTHTQVPRAFIDWFSTEAAYEIELLVNFDGSEIIMSVGGKNIATGIVV
jgi:hypothetical protein